MSKVNSGSTMAKERKPLEEQVVGLRKELHVLYDSLKDKDEQIMALEKEVRDRDISIRFLKNEFAKLKESRKEQPTDMAVKPKKATEIDGDGLISLLQRELKEKEFLFKELNQKIMRLSDDLTYVQRQSLAKDDRVADMQNELDKYRQIVSPITKAMIENHKSRSDSMDEWCPGVESTRILPVVAEPRMKRQAISAEPLSQMAGLEGDLVRIPKSHL